MVREPLTDEMVRAGRKLTERLDGIGFEVVAAFWLFTSEWSAWRLIIGSPQVETDGPRAAYTRIQEALQDQPDVASVLGLHNITVAGPGEPFIKVLRTAITTGKDISGIRFSRNVINNVLVEDAYIYRLL